MLYVIATIELNQGCKDDFLKIFKDNVPNVKAEKGCITYEPTVDVDSGIPVQDELRSDVVTIVEAWDGLDDLTNTSKPRIWQLTGKKPKTWLSR